MRYEVYATAFHGGRLISRHHTLEAAEKAKSKHMIPNCICGCAGVIDRGAGQKPGTQEDQDRQKGPGQGKSATGIMGGKTKGGTEK